MAHNLHIVLLPGIELLPIYGMDGHVEAGHGVQGQQVHRHMP